MAKVARDKQLSAVFWNVFGLGKGIDEAEAIVRNASFVDIEEWSDLASQSWAGFERIIAGDEEFLNAVSWKFSWFQRMRWRLPQFPYEIKIVRKGTPND